MTAPPSLGLALRAMAYNNAWANLRLHAAVAGLPPGGYAAPRPGFFPSLKATLEHVLQVDLFYVAAAEGRPARFVEEPTFDDPAALAAAQAALDARLIACCAPDADFARVVAIPRDHGTQRERLDRLLLHLFQHQIHHRGQAHAMLSHAGVAPPQLDEFFAAAEAPLRAAEFAALGWTEDGIWGGGGAVG